MTGRCLRVTVALALVSALIAMPASAAFEPARVDDPWLATQYIDWLTNNMPPAQMLLGMLIGLVAGELMRVAWRTLEWLLFTIYVFAKVTARYGAIAAIIGCALYFI